MHLTLLQAQLVCCALLASDLAARAWRIQLLLSGVGHRVGLGSALAINSIGDFASALTPLRFGGEPARFAAMLREGIPLRARLLALGYEVAVEWPVGVAVVVCLSWLCGRSWWHSAAPTVLRRAVDLWPWVLLVLATSALALGVGWQRMRAAKRRTLRLADEPPGRPRHVRGRALLAAAVLTFVSISARVAVLPALTLTLPHAPELDVVAFGSFALLYGQLLLPTPSGLGAVDLAFLGGAAGDLGPGPGGLLLYWRLYTTGTSAMLGGVLTVRLYGRKGLVQVSGWLRRRSKEPSVKCDVRLAQERTLD